MSVSLNGLQSGRVVPMLNCSQGLRQEERQMSRIFGPFAVLVFVASWTATSAIAADINVWTASAFGKVIRQVRSDFEVPTGTKIVVREGLRDEFFRRIEANEPFDVLILPRPAIEGLTTQGKIVAEGRLDLARSGIGVEVRAGARKPDITSVEAFRRALLEAKSIAYLRVGSGEYIHGMIERLGIADAIRAKVIRPPTDTVSDMVAKGEVELGIVASTQIVTTPGVELAGPMPAELQNYLIFTGGVSAQSKVQTSARALLRFLTSPVAVQAIKSGGMEPG